MTEGRLIECVLAEASCAKRRLSLEEVLEAGLPAVYHRHGDRLLYRDGRIFDAADPWALAEIPFEVADASVQAVGLEFGWRHAGDCFCHFCSERAADTAARASPLRLRLATLSGGEVLLGVRAQPLGLLGGEVALESEEVR